MKIAGVNPGTFYIGDRYIADPTHNDVRELIARDQALTPAQADFLIRYAALTALANSTHTPTKHRSSGHRHDARRGHGAGPLAPRVAAGKKRPSK